MTRKTLLLALVATAALAGCNSKDHTIVAGSGIDNETPATNAPVVLPPSIASSASYRCKDNSVVYIDWMSDNKSATYRAERTDSPVALNAPEAGQPMVADGYSLTGAPGGKSITLTRPGKGSQSCSA